MATEKELLQRIEKLEKQLDATHQAMTMCMSENLDFVMHVVSAFARQNLEKGVFNLADISRICNSLEEIHPDLKHEIDVLYQCIIHGFEK